MYFNVFGERVSRRRHREMLTAAKNRRELIAAGLGRRDLFRMGLLTGAGMLAPIRGLSAQAQTGGSNSVCVPTNQAASPPTRPFVEPLTVMPVKQPVASLTPTPTAVPNNAAGEGRTRIHQAFGQFPPQHLYQITQEAALAVMSPDLPPQTIWGFDGIAPGPTYVAHYGQANLVRNVNQLPSDNGGFGNNQITTHLHNGHTPSESDGFPCDFFPNPQNPAIANAFFYDQHYPNVLAGILSDHQSTGGDINESFSLLWYRDH